MNIFALSFDPTEAARFQCDKHITKMTVEAYQCLGSAVIRHGATPDMMTLTQKGTPLKGGYHNHPATRWAGDTQDNFLWLCFHAAALAEEFERRFGKTHFCVHGIEHLFHMHNIIPKGDLTPFARCFNQSKGENLDLLEWECPVEAYREFYRRDKASIAQWNHFRKAPEWWNDNQYLYGVKYEVAQ